jgi:hypothetical protein
MVKARHRFDWKAILYIGDYGEPGAGEVTMSMTKEARLKYILTFGLLVGTSLLISASASKDISTFIWSFGAMVFSYVIALGAALTYVILQRRRRLQNISALFRQNIK